MFRVNAQLTTAANLASGGGVPGGTSIVLYIDSADSKLKAIYPNGDVYVAGLVNGTNNITFTKP